MDKRLTGWSFLTGQREAVNELLEVHDMGVKCRQLPVSARLPQVLSAIFAMSGKLLERAELK